MQAFGGISWGGTKKQEKTKILESSRRRGLKSPKSLVFLFFLVPLQENASFWWKTLPFPGEVPKKPKKTKILESEESKIFGFFGLFGTPPGKCKLLVENVAIS